MRMRTVILWGAMVAIAAAVGADELGARLEQRVGEVLAGKVPVTEVRIDVVWANPGRTSLQVFGNGVAIWGREKQFSLTETQILALLPLFGKHGFYAMPERPAPKWEKRQPEGPVIMRAVVLTVGDLSKEVLQTDRVPTLQPFEDLVKALFDACEEAAAKAVTPKDLADGLDLIAKGALAPESLILTLSQPPQGGASVEGRVISVANGEVSLQRLSPGKPPSTSPVRRLTPAEARALGALLRDVAWPKMPQNLVRDGYTDLNVMVLRHRHVVQARRFTGKDPATQTKEREKFEKVFAAVEVLTRPVAN